MPASSTKAASVKKSGKVKTEEKKVRKGKRDFTGYQRFIYKLMKAKKNKVGKMRITSKGMAIMNSLVHDLFDRLATEAGRLARHAKQQTLSSRAVLAAVKLHYPAELASHALSAGASAVASYEKATSKNKKKSNK